MGPLFASLLIPEELLDEDMTYYHLVDGVFTLRPPEPSFELTAIVDQPFVFLNLSEGVMMEITDRLYSRTSFAYDSSDPLIFTETGAYCLNIRQEYPLWNIIDAIVEVRNA